jgi:hypothetical protein
MIFEKTPISEKAPISEKQLAANRRNAELSTGARTSAGKARSSMNNLRHGLTGQINILPTEDREAHDRFCTELADSLQPETPMEKQLAHSVAEDNWRLNRARAIENNMFALGHQGERREIQVALADARTFQAQANQFQLLTIYEQRISRNVQRNMQQLQALQTERRLLHDQALEEAQLLAQQSLLNGLAYDPAKDGFGFSNAEINFAIDRGNRLREAKQAASSTPKPPAQPKPFAARAA